MDLDHLIIGAGVVGTATAYHLKRMDPDASVLVIDKEKRAGAGNTAKSAALYRNIFSSPISQKLSTSSIKYYLELGDTIQMRPIGYLWIFSEDQWDRSIEAIKTLDQSRDSFDVLDRNSIIKMMKINSEGAEHFPSVDRGIHGHLCGSLSGMGLAQHYLKEFISLGGEVRMETEITNIDLHGNGSRYAPWDRAGISSISDREGNSFRSGTYLFATGAWTQEILGTLGVFTGVLPKKRQLFGIRIDDPQQIVNDLAPGDAPAMILPAGGTYIKPILDRNLMVLGLADGIGQPYTMSDPGHDEEYFSKAIMPVINHYFPGLKDYELKMKWAGYYAYHWPDKNPVIENDGNIFWASGTSGSGIMKADGIGRAAAAKLLGYEQVELFDGDTIKVTDLSLRDRNTGHEKFVI